jgi:chitodextrinase
MKNLMTVFSFMLLSISVMLFSPGCGGGGGGGGNNLQPPTYNATGLWNVTETGKSGNCPQLAPKQNYSLAVNHSAGSNSLVVTDLNTNMTYPGTISGSTINYSGPGIDSNCPDGFSLSVTLTMSSETFLSGNATWTCNYTGGSCNGTTTFTASKSGGGSDTTAPTVPTGLTVIAASPSQINLSWNPSTDNVGIAGYRIYRNGFLKSVTNTSTSDSGLSANTQYCYRVSAYDGANNESSQSAQQCATTLSGGSGDISDPSVPTNLTGTVVSSSQINLTWTASTDNVGVTGYRLERCQGVACSSFTQIAAPASTGYNDTGLTALTSCTYRVRAVDAAGNISGYSNTFTATTQAGGGGGDSIAPTAPSGLIATSVTTNQVTLSWNASTDNVSVTGYRVERCLGGRICVGGYSEIGVTSSTSFTDSGLSAGTGYLYRVRAQDAAGNLSTYSNTRSVITLSSSQTITLKPVYDNIVYVNNIIPSEADTAYQLGPLPVGCNWTYDYLMDYQGLVCGQGLVQFNLSSLAGKTIGSAILKLKASSIGVGYYPRMWHVRALASTWDPSTVTWNIVENFQYYLASEILLYPPGYYGQSTSFEINVTSIVKNWINGTWSNYGLIFGSEDYTWPYTTSFDLFELYSLEDTGQEWPELVITYQ